MSEATQKSELREKIIAALKQVHDPEIPINIYDLGLIYEIDVDDNANAAVKMTLTTPNCPVAESMPGMVENKVKSVEGVMDATVELVWEPQWTGDKMTEDARLQLEMLGIDWSNPGAAGRGPTSLTIGRKPAK